MSGAKSLADAQTNPYPDDDAEAAPKVSLKEQRSLRRAKAEARSGYNEGKRLAEKRDMVLRDNGALLLTEAQTAMLKKFDDGVLRHNMNQAIAKTGHGKLALAAGETLNLAAALSADHGASSMDGCRLTGVSSSRRRLAS